MVDNPNVIGAVADLESAKASVNAAELTDELPPLQAELVRDCLDDALRVLDRYRETS